MANLLLIFLIIFSLFRFATFLAFKPDHLSFIELLPSFILGVRYDLRWIAIILLPIVLISVVPRFSPFFSAQNKRWWTWYLAAITLIVFFFFGADFGSFSYNQTRLDAGAMNFAEDFSTSWKMIWQTYPIIWMLLGLIVAVIFFRWMYQKSHWHVINLTEGKGISHRREFFITALLVFAVLIYGRIATTALTWKSSFVFRDNFKSYLALNPLQNFFSTLQFRRPDFNEQKARDAFPVMAQWMPLHDKTKFSYHRYVQPGSNAIESHPNIVLVLCESFSMYKSSMSGNPLNSTAFFDSLRKEGIFFSRCFSPHFSTARGLFATITGIPDAQFFKFSTRSPEALKQRTIINNFERYDKHYFLGGDPDFNNFRGLLNNIDNLQMHTGDDFKLPKINVWGISDKDLFLAANDVFKKATAPFFAIVQTSDNHRPYMIPNEDSIEFKTKNVHVDTLAKYGFESINEYNSFRYSDFCFQKFIEAAKKENYFHNTIFVFIGDHGVAGDATQIYPQAWTSQRLTDEHVPLLFYAPYLLKAQERKEVVSQIDVLPTIASMLQQPYLNSTLGRDLLDPNKKNNFAFITNAAGKIGIVTDDFYLIKNSNFPDEEMVPVSAVAETFSKQKKDSIQKQLSVLSTVFFETAKYLLVNNEQD